MSNSLLSQSPSKGPTQLPEFKSGKMSTQRGPSGLDSIEGCIEKIANNKEPLHCLINQSKIDVRLGNLLAESLGVEKVDINIPSNRTICGVAHVKDQEIQIL